MPERQPAGNRSVPTDTLLPHVIYQDVAAALVWLSKAFGFREHYRYGHPDSPQGAQMRAGEAWIMLESARDGSANPALLGLATQYLTLIVDDVDQHHERVSAAGARIVEALNETVYGERQYVAADPEGHRWLFSQHVRDGSPDEWGAIVSSSGR